MASGVVAGIAYVTGVVVIAHVVIDLLYLKKVAFFFFKKKKKQKKKTKMVHSLGWWMVLSLRWLGII